MCLEVFFCTSLVPIVLLLFSSTSKLSILPSKNHIRLLQLVQPSSVYFHKNNLKNIFSHPLPPFEILCWFPTFVLAIFTTSLSSPPSNFTSNKGLFLGPLWAAYLGTPASGWSPLITLKMVPLQLGVNEDLWIEYKSDIECQSDKSVNQSNKVIKKLIRCLSSFSNGSKLLFLFTVVKTFGISTTNCLNIHLLITAAKSH